MTRPRLPSRIRSLLVATVSALVLLTGLAYVVAPENTSVQLSVAESAGAQHYDETVQPRYSLTAAQRARPGRRPADHETIYGSVTTGNSQVGDVTLSITGDERKTRNAAAYFSLRPNATFHSRVSLPAGRYTFKISLRVNGSVKTISTKHSLSNGYSYGVRVRVRNSGAITFFPVTSY